MDKKRGLLNYVHGGNTALENLNYFEYLEAKLQCDGSDEAAVLQRMVIARIVHCQTSEPTTDCLGH